MVRSADFLTARREESRRRRRAASGGAWEEVGMHKKKRSVEKKGSSSSKGRGFPKKEAIVRHPVVPLPKEEMDRLIAQHFPALRRHAARLLGGAERIRPGRDIDLSPDDLTSHTQKKVMELGVIRAGWDFCSYEKSKMRQYLGAKLRKDKTRGDLAIEHKDEMEECCCDETERSLRNPWVSGDHEPDRECPETEEDTGERG